MSRPTTMAACLLVCLAVAASLQAASAAHIYTGVESFINTFTNLTTVELEGITVRLATPAESYGLKLAGMSALHITLAPCTVLQPHIHPHPEFLFSITGKVTHSVVYNNMTLATVTENTMKDVQTPGFAVFPTGQLHVTQNEGCMPAELLAVFPVPAPDQYFFPATEAFLPANTIASFFGGKTTSSDLSKLVGSAPLSGCKCGRKMGL